MKLRKTRKKRKQRGGVLFRFSNAAINAFTPVGVGSRDCCPCVFKLLGMSEGEARRLAMMMPGGFSVSQMQNFFRMKYPDYDFSFESTGNLKSIGDSRFIAKISQLLQKIPPGYASVGGYQREDNTRHCIAFARSLSGTPYIFDAQSGQGVRGSTGIIGYLAQHNVVEIWLLRSLKKGKKIAAKGSLILPQAKSFDASVSASSAAGGGSSFPKTMAALKLGPVSQSEMDRGMATVRRAAAQAPSLALEPRRRAEHYNAAEESVQRRAIQAYAPLSDQPFYHDIRALDSCEALANNLRTYYEYHGRCHPDFPPEVCQDIEDFKRQCREERARHHQKKKGGKRRKRRTRRRPRRRRRRGGSITRNAL